MADWNPSGARLVFEDDTTGAGNYTQDVISGGASNTKGSYTQLVASLPQAVVAIIISWMNDGAAYVLTDIAIGAGGSEQVVVPNFYGSMPLQGQSSNHAIIPISLAAGARVALRVQASTGTHTTKYKLQFITATFVGSFQAPDQYQDWGADLGQSFGQNVGASTPGVKGSYAELFASTARTTRWLFVGAQSVTAGSADFFVADIAVGAAGLEHIVIPDLFGNVNPLDQVYGPIPLVIPAGTRVAARIAATAGGMNHKFHMHGGA